MMKRSLFLLLLVTCSVATAEDPAAPAGNAAEGVSTMTLEEAAAGLETVLELREEGAFEESLKLAESIYQTYLELRGPDNPETIEAQIAYARSLFAADQFKASAKVYREAIGAYEQLPTAEASVRDRYRGGLAEVILRLGQLDGARAIVEDIIQRLDQEERRSTVLGAKTLHTLAIIAYRQRRAGEFYEVSREAYEIYKALKGPRAMETARALRDHGLSMVLRGECLEAEKVYQEALEVAIEQRGMEDYETVAILNGIAGVQMCLDDYVGAAESTGRATEISAKLYGDDSVKTARVKMNYAFLSDWIGEVERSERLHREVIATLWDKLGDKDPTYGMAINNFGAVLHGAGRDEEALPYLREAYDLRLELFGKDHPLTSKTAMNLSGCLVNLGQREEALPLARNALENLRQRVGEDHVQMVRGYHGLASSLLPEAGNTEAMELALKSLGIVWRNALLSFQTLPEERKVSWLEQQQQRYDLPLSLLARDFDSTDEQRRKTWEYLLLGKNLTLRLLAGQYGAIQSLGDPDLLERYEQMLREKEKYARFVYQPPRGLPEEEVAAELERLEASISAAEAFISRKSVVYAIQQEALTTTLDDVLGALTEGVAIVDYYVFEHKTEGEQGRRYGAFVGTVDGVRFVDLGNADSLETGIELVRDEIMKSREGLGEAGKATLETLHRRVIEALQLPDTVDQLIIVPDGALHLLPFDALHDGETWLLERMQLQLLSNAADIALQDRVERETFGSDQVLADPAFDGPDALRDVVATMKDSAEYFASEALSLAGLRNVECRSVSDIPTMEPLPGSRREGRNVRRHLRRSNDIALHLGSDATVAALLAVERPRVLHLATHGFFMGNCDESGVNPLLLSGLAFTGANQPGEFEEAAFLTAYQASQLDLRQTSLVVLSACDTGVGVPQADGLHGLRRAFEHAGAATVVTSLWPVPDRETAELMDVYYDLLADGVGTVSALQQAKKSLRESLIRRHGKDIPATWAGFVAVGQDQALPGI